MGFFSRLFAGRRARPTRVDLDRRFERLRESSVGTMSTFYKVRDNVSGELRGLKLIDRLKSEPIEARYRGLGKPGEGEIGLAIRGPNVVRTLEWGVSSDGAPFVLQEFIEGTLLHGLLMARTPLSPAQRLDLVALDQIEVPLQVLVLGHRLVHRSRRDRRAGGLGGELLESLDGQRDDLARAVPGVHQTAQHPELVDLLDGVDPLPELVAIRVGKSVAPLPDPERVLGQPGIAFDRRDGARQGRRRVPIVHDPCCFPASSWNCDVWTRGWLSRTFIDRLGQVS
jgi:hypothetical protein